MRERTPKTPVSNRSIIRIHSPYCESAGPIVQEGFVAARVRALQGFSNRGPIASRSHPPGTPCSPRWLHAYKSRRLSRPSLALKPVLTAADMPSTSTAKHFHTEVLEKDYPNLVDPSGGKVRSSDVGPSIQLQEQKSSPESIMPSRLYFESRGATDPSLNLYTDTSSSPQAQRDRDYMMAPRKSYGPLPEVDRAGDVPEENSSPFEKAILSPHAIQIELVEPRASWDFPPQTEDYNKEQCHEQALKPQASIANKLGSMVERGWVLGDTFDQVYVDDECASYTTEDVSQVRDTRLDRRNDSLNRMPRLKTMPSYNRFLSVTASQMRSESQHLMGQDSCSYGKQEESSTYVYRAPQNRTQLQARRTHAISTIQRSSSDSEVHYHQTERQTSTKKRRAWTLHRLGCSMSDDGQTQREGSSIKQSSHARDDHSDEQDWQSMKSPLSHEGSIPKTGTDPTMLEGDQLRQNFVALSKVTGSRSASLNTKGPTRSASRSTSFFKKFPWYRVALVDKQPLVQDLSIGGRGSSRNPRSTQAAQYDPMRDQTELSRYSSKSRTFDEGRYLEVDDALRTKAPPNPDSADQRAMDTITPDCKATWQPCLELMTFPQRMNEQQSLETGPQDYSTTSSEIKKERSFRNQVKDMFGLAQSPTWTIPHSAQSRIHSQSGSVDAGFDSARSGDALQALQTQWSKIRGHSRMQSYASSYANLTELHADNRPEHGSSGSRTAEPDQTFTTNSYPSAHLRSKVVYLSPTPSGTRRNSLPANVDKSDKYEPARREVKGRGKGIKKIQVTVTFDGAEELVVEAMLKRKDRQASQDNGVTER